MYTLVIALLLADNGNHWAETAQLRWKETYTSRAECEVAGKAALAQIETALDYEQRIRREHPKADPLAIVMIPFEVPYGKAFMCVPSNV